MLVDHTAVKAKLVYRSMGEANPSLTLGIFPKIRITFKTFLWELWKSYSGLCFDQNNLLKDLIKWF